MLAFRHRLLTFSLRFLFQKSTTDNSLIFEWIIGIDSFLLLNTIDFQPCCWQSFSFHRPWPSRQKSNKIIHTLPNESVNKGVEASFLRRFWLHARSLTRTLFTLTLYDDYHGYLSGVFEETANSVNENSNTRSLRFKSRARQIGYNVANSSPPLRHFFEKSCVAQAQWHGDGSCKLITHFGVVQQLKRKIWFDLKIQTNPQKTQVRGKLL